MNLWFVAEAGRSPKSEEPLVTFRLLANDLCNFRKRLLNNRFIIIRDSRWLSDCRFSPWQVCLPISWGFLYLLETLLCEE